MDRIPNLHDMPNRALLSSSFPGTGAPRGFLKLGELAKQERLLLKGGGEADESKPGCSTYERVRVSDT